MYHRYILLKNARGIAITMDINEFLDPNLEPGDVEVADKIFLRVNHDSKVLKSIAEKWMGKALSDSRQEIYSRIGDPCVLFFVEKLDFHILHFQDEGLYCAMLEWLAAYYDYPKVDIPVVFDEVNRRFNFTIPS
jgi:hypothetical protein